MNVELIEKLAQYYDGRELHGWDPHACVAGVLCYRMQSEVVSAGAGGLGWGEAMVEKALGISKTDASLIIYGHGAPWNGGAGSGTRVADALRQLVRIGEFKWGADHEGDE